MRCFGARAGKGEEGYMKWLGAGCAVVILGINAYSGEVIFKDPFAGKIDADWSWIRENSEGWRVSDGALEILVQPGNMWGDSNDARNVLVRSAPKVEDGAIEVSCKVENEPTNQYEQVDLVWYYDDSNMVKNGLELVDGQISLVMGREEEDEATTLCIIPLETTVVEVRMTVRGEHIVGHYRVPGSDEWLKAGECDLPVKGEPKISIQCYQGPKDAEHWARISDFEVRKVTE
jgi:regulation of enolase protein 1 (concanavalin A-like superfamily)